MKHLKAGRKLKRTKDQRKALLKTMLGSLILYEKIITTEAKAKELKRLIDPIINTAKKSEKATAIRRLSQIIPKASAKKITGEFLKKFSSRNSGYTRVIKLSSRQSDDAKMSVIEFMD